MLVLSVVGNRPQFVKSAPLSLALRNAGIDEVVLHTGQHYDPELSQVFFDELGIDEPRYRLDLRTADPAAMAPAIADAVARERPDWVLVLGDTASTLAGAEGAGDTPIAQAKRREEETLADPLVQAAVEIFGAEVRGVRDRRP